MHLQTADRRHNRGFNRGLLACVFLLLGATSVAAQGTEFTFRPPTDSAILAARALVVDGKFDEGRAVLDSILAAHRPTSEMYPEALYWRGALAATAADAERDYRRLLIETPFAPRAEDAMLQLAQLQHARGDRKGAADHLQRYLLTFPNSESRPARPRAALWYVRLQFELNQTARGCEAVRIAREAVANESLELKNQLEFYAPRCAYVDAAPVEPAQPPVQAPAPATTPVATQQAAPPADTVAREKKEPAPAADSASAADSAPPAPKRPKAATPPPAGKGVTFYSVQVAAYDSQEAAKRMADGLIARGLAARVDGTARPFRVRIGKFANRADAVKLAQTLKAQGQNGFVAKVQQ